MPRRDEPVDRRRFFRAGLRELLKPLVNAAAPLEQAIDQLSRLSEQPKPPQKFLRPPGSIDESRFSDVCIRCGTCVSVCPAQCIKIDSTKTIGNGAPYIDPDIMPCVVCDGLVCMRSCPSGAIVPTALGLIDMGTAIWDEKTCLRSHGEDCTICIDQCPIGSMAIELRDNRIHVKEKGCVGCGMCQHHCPTNPKSIRVSPRASII